MGSGSIQSWVAHFPPSIQRQVFIRAGSSSSQLPKVKRPGNAIDRFMPSFYDVVGAVISRVTNGTAEDIDVVAVKAGRACLNRGHEEEEVPQ